MNQRILKINLPKSFEKMYDPEAPKFFSNHGSVTINGFDKDGDQIHIRLEDEDAHSFIELAQGLAMQEYHVVNNIKSQLGLLEFRSTTEEN